MSWQICAGSWTKLVRTKTLPEKKITSEKIDRAQIMHSCSRLQACIVDPTHLIELLLVAAVSSPSYTNFNIPY